MRIAITGTTGRVGRAIYIRLSKGHDVVGLDRAPSSTADIIADLEDPSAIARLLEGADAVVHTAALHAPQVGHVPDREFERINVRATERLLDACIKRGVRRFVLTSTTALFGDAVGASRGAAWLDESVVPQPRSIYHHTKLQSERLVEASGASGNMATAVLRMSRCFPEPADMMAAYRLHRGIDARDVASAHQVVVESGTAGHQVFVVSGATPFQQDDCLALAEDAVSVLHARAPEFVEAFKQRGWVLPSKIDRVCVPNALISKGWVPRFGFEDVLQQFGAESGEVLIPRRS